MIASAGAGGATTVFIFVIGTLATVLIAVLGWVFNYILREIRDDLKETQKHLEGVLATIGPLMWRLIMLEEFEGKINGYLVPRDIGWVEQVRRGTRDDG